MAADVGDFREQARRRLPRFLFDYVDGGSWSEQTLASNVADLRRVRLRQRVMRDVSKVDLTARLFGRDHAMPVGLGPVGLAGMYARRGEVQAARAAAAAGIPFTLSTLSVCAVEEVASASSAPIWFQLYMIRDRGFLADLLARVREAGCSVLVLTVDLPVAAVRLRDVRSGLSARRDLAARMRWLLDLVRHPRWAVDVGIHGRPHACGNVAPVMPQGSTLSRYWSWIAANFDPAVTWRDLDFIRRHWPGPLVVKGLMEPGDAEDAIRSGIDGIVVSNHGGRQLDGAPSSISALPAIAAAVAGRTIVMMDGGVRSGTDVLKVLGAGADAVLLGRAWAYALAADGERGVGRMLDLIRSELAMAMAMTGVGDLARLRSDGGVIHPDRI